MGRVQILKGNISELLAIAGQSFHGTGIDAGKEDAMTDENEEERRRIFRTFSQQTGSVLLATGARDLLVDQERCLILEMVPQSCPGSPVPDAWLEHLLPPIWHKKIRLSQPCLAFLSWESQENWHNGLRKAPELPDRTAGRSGRDAPGSTGSETSDPRDRSVTYVNSEFKRMGAKKSLLA